MGEQTMIVVLKQQLLVVRKIEFPASWTSRLTTLVAVQLPHVEASRRNLVKGQLNFGWLEHVE
jgi:hypothetical protein